MATSYIPEKDFNLYGIPAQDPPIPLSSIQALLHQRNGMMRQAGDMIRISFNTGSETGWNATQYTGFLCHITNLRCWCLVGDVFGKLKMMVDNQGTWTVYDIH